MSTTNNFNASVVRCFESINGASSLAQETKQEQQSFSKIQKAKYGPIK